MTALLIVGGLLVCAFLALRTPRLLVAATWLAGASALTALLLYQLGAPEVAVVELSVGAGLVTVLFVFAINIAGDEPTGARPLVPRALAGALVVVAVALLARLAAPALEGPAAALAPGVLGTVLWEERTLDVLLQVVLVFAGVLAVLGLLGGESAAEKAS